MPSRKKPSKRTVVGMSSVDRQVALYRAVKLQNTTIMRVAKEVFGVSYSHLRCVLKNERRPSKRLAQRICNFVQVTPAEFFGTPDFSEHEKPEDVTTDE